VSSRPLYLPDIADYADVPVYSRYELGVGHRITGPAIIQETESTIVVARNATIDILSDLTISVDLGEGAA
jgi:N-methylhydantoinase A